LRLAGAKTDVSGAIRPLQRKSETYCSAPDAPCQSMIGGALQA